MEWFSLLILAPLLFIRWCEEIEEIAMDEKAYKHDWSGSCRPHGMCYMANRTFSVGIFQWVPQKNGKGLKKSAVKYRIKGYSSFPNDVYDRADEVCKRMDEGWVPPHKSETV